MSAQSDVTPPADGSAPVVEILAIGARQTLAPGQTGDTAIVPQGGTITFMMPNQAAQLLASLSPSSIYLTLLPDGYQAEALPPLSLDLLEGPTPAELPSCLTPWGPDGYIEGDSTAVAGRKAIGGALRLYLDFINLFLMLLSLFGSRE